MFDNLKGVNSLFENQGAEFSTIPLDMIEVKSQVREIFEDEDNSLADLAENIKKQGVLQPILLRPTENGYELIAGERRLRAAKMAGLEMIPAYIREMSDEEAENAQFSENVHRKNLTQIEESKKLQRDIERLGSVEAVCELHQKSHSWLSKRLSLLALPEQTKRLVIEDISADIEAINTVKTIEKRDPEAAKILVDKLKETGGKNARDESAAVKATVKPLKTKKTEIVEEQVNIFDIEDEDQGISKNTNDNRKTSFNLIEDMAKNKNMGGGRIQALIKEREELKREKSRIESRLISIADEIENIESRI